MNGNKASDLDFTKILGESNTEFEDFSAALARLMTKGLNSMSPGIQYMVSKSIEAGSELVAVVACNPIKLTAVLQLSDGKTAKLFEFSEDFHT